ncbi:cytochrome P450 [Streptomyces noursei]|uniref:cytochrome P450 n=1 Tax=Streptomyces noursei TaxID=1971 RepID=UPI00382962F1
MTTTDAHPPTSRTAAEGPPAFPFDDWGQRISPAYARLREAPAPACRVVTVTGDQVWLVTRYDLARRLLADPRLSLTAALEADAPRQEPLRPRATGARGDGMATLQERGLRGILADALSPRAIRAHHAWTRLRARALFDELSEQGPPADLQQGLARPLTFAVARRVLLGELTEDEGQVLNAWCDTVLVWRDRTRDEIQAALDAMYGFFLRRAPELAAAPGSDVVKRAAAACTRDGGRLGADGLAEVANLMLIAGYRTAASFVANALVMMLSHPTALAALRDRPALLPSMVEEVLRHTPMSTGGVKRVATDDVPLDGLTIKAGECVLVSLESGNHDPHAYPEPDRFAPDRFAADRGPVDGTSSEAGRPRSRPHLGFGHGKHHCPGNALARMQIAVVLETLADHAPALRLAVPAGELRWRPDVAFRIPETIPVTW